LASKSYFDKKTKNAFEGFFTLKVLYFKKEKHSQKQLYLNKS